MEAKGKQIVDLTGIDYCPNLTLLNLEDNQISDIFVLARNTGISGTINLKSNPLNIIALSTYIPTLESKDIKVEYDLYYKSKLHQM